LAKVVALEQLRDRRRAHQPEQLLHRHVQPLAVVTDLEVPYVQHLDRLLLEGARVGVDLLGLEHRTGARAPARIADPGGVVADDQHDSVAEVLKLAQLLQDDRVTNVDIGRGRVHAELDAQRPAERQLALEPPLRQAIDGVAREPVGPLGRRNRLVVHRGQW
jgi:hypothetical protein